LYQIDKIYYLLKFKNDVNKEFSLNNNKIVTVINSTHIHLNNYTTIDEKIKNFNKNSHYLNENNTNVINEKIRKKSQNNGNNPKKVKLNNLNINNFNIGYCNEKGRVKKDKKRYTTKYSQENKWELNGLEKYIVINNNRLIIYNNNTYYFFLNKLPDDRKKPYNKKTDFKNMDVNICEKFNIKGQKRNHFYEYKFIKQFFDNITELDEFPFQFYESIYKGLRKKIIDMNKINTFQTKNENGVYKLDLKPFKKMEKIDEFENIKLNSDLNFEEISNFSY
jgi:hypothetical protein